jgi:hypothetical protein
MKRVAFLTIVVVALTMASSVFAAAKPGGYLGAAGNVQNAVGPTAPGGVLAETGTQAGQLPFTGTDLVVFTAVGLVLIGAGVSMRRGSRRRN